MPMIPIMRHLFFMWHLNTCCLPRAWSPNTLTPSDPGLLHLKWTQSYESDEMLKSQECVPRPTSTSVCQLFH